MLSRLEISNYALIDRLEVGFNPGLTIITGQTGAGKSILLGALSLLMGGRADSKTRNRETEKTIVEATFTIEGEEEIEKWFESEGLDYSQQTIVRREISASGRSRAFINDTPVNLNVLSALMSGLIGIHSQNATIELRKERSQLSMLDLYCGNDEEREAYRCAFKEYVSTKMEYERLRRQSAERSAQLTTNMRILEDLRRLNAKRGEMKALERRFDILSEATEIKCRLSEARMLLSNQEGEGVISSLSRLRTIAGTTDCEIYGENANINERLYAAEVEMQDILGIFTEAEERIDTDPAALSLTEQRMEELHSAMRRYDVKDIDELVEMQERLEREAREGEISPERLRGAEQEMHVNARALKEAARLLSESREKGGKTFSEELTLATRPLGLPHLQFEVSIKRKKLMQDGQDEIEFLCRFNKNQQPMPISDSASGGEMSRLMLGIKSIMARRQGLRTEIFDEVDTGVSGEIAHKMGEMMQKMSESAQVIAITHLPQVASKGDVHMKVYKTDETDKTSTHLTILNKEERIMELAHMLSGARIEEASIRNARQLLGEGQN